MKTITPLGQASNEFALGMYARLRQRPGNVFFSPFSIRAALAMALAGAKGATAAEMQRTLGIAPGEESHAAFAEVIRRLNAEGGDTFEMAVANSLWGQDAAPLLPEFLDRVSRHYGGGLDLVDFRRDAEAARGKINRWVEDKTRRKIRDLIPRGGVDAETRLVLANAVYFKGEWVDPFEKSSTMDQPFYLGGGKVVSAPLMFQQERMRYAKASGFQAVDLEYWGGELSLLVLVPDKKDGLRDLEAEITERSLDECVVRMESREVELYLPRFNATWGTEDVGGELAALGMELPFDRERADFSGMNGLQQPHEDSLFLSAVYHKAFADVNEAGTEAAAATAAIGTRCATAPFQMLPPRIPVVRADHPFLYAIRDRQSRAILFFGRVADPTMEGGR